MHVHREVLSGRLANDLVSAVGPVVMHSWNDVHLVVIVIVVVGIIYNVHRSVIRNPVGIFRFIVVFRTALMRTVVRYRIVEIREVIP